MTMLISTTIVVIIKTVPRAAEQPGWDYGICVQAAPPEKKSGRVVLFVIFIIMCIMIIIMMTIIVMIIVMIMLMVMIFLLGLWPLYESRSSAREGLGHGMVWYCIA